MPNYGIPWYDSWKDEIGDVGQDAEQLDTPSCGVVECAWVEPTPCDEKAALHASMLEWSRRMMPILKELSMTRSSSRFLKHASEA